MCAGLVGSISYNLYFDCKHVQYVTCNLINVGALFDLIYLTAILWSTAAWCFGEVDKDANSQITVSQLTC